MNLIRPKLGDYLRELRDGRTLHEVTMGTDIQTSMLSRIESGERLPTLEHVKRLSKFYKVPVETLIKKRTMEKIIEQHGVNKITYAAIKQLNTDFVPLFKKSKNK